MTNEKKQRGLKQILSKNQDVLASQLSVNFHYPAANVTVFPFDQLLV